MFLLISAAILVHQNGTKVRGTFRQITQKLWTTKT